MTKDGIMQLEGRELDAAVAEHVFGYQWINDGCDNMIAGPDLIKYLKRRYGDYHDGKDQDLDDILDYVSQYSSDIKYAWRVWQKVGGGIIEGNDEDGYRIAAFASAQIDETLVAGKYKTGREGWSDEPIILADTAPLAICRAALLTVSSELESTEDTHEK